jgi:hypothetical protein
MQKRVYVETSVISYLQARPSRDLVVAAHQEITRQWWSNESAKYDLYVSEAMPPQAALDALHVAVAAWHGADYLLTWNCRHIASAHVRPRIDALCRARGIASPQLCTPEELMEA